MTQPASDMLAKLASVMHMAVPPAIVFVLANMVISDKLDSYLAM